VNLAKPWLLFLIALSTSHLFGVRPPTPLAPTAPLQTRRNVKGGDYGVPVQVALLKDKVIKESSGLAASRNVPGVYWTHNDSGDGPFIYAFDTRGVRRGVWRVAGASANDWEDMAAGPGPVAGKNYLYIGDIGDNAEKRSEVIVYRVPEPVVGTANNAKAKTFSTEPAESIHLRYPDGSHDAEALLVHPITGAIYIVTKILFGNPGIYEAATPLKAGATITLARIGTLSVPSLLGGIITGGAISPDGRRIAFCDYMQGYEAVLPDTKAAFNTIWKRPLTSFALGSRKQGESITYRLDGKALLATSEGSPMPLIQVVRR
jgi:hypothetical protein